MNTQNLTRVAAAAALAVATLPAALQGSAQAQSVNQPFTTHIYVQNPNAAPATGAINFYPELSGTAVITAAVNLNLNPYGSAEVLVGSLTLSSPWKGSAVISADQSVVAASIQVPPSGYGHIMANAFTSSDATSNLFLTTFLRNVGNEVSLLAVQNTESEPVDVRARFILPTGATVADVTVTLPANASKFFDGNNPATITNTFPATFNGSVVVTATKQSNGQPALIVGTSETRRTDTTGTARFRAYGFEAIPQSAGALTIYMPTALCKFGAGSPTTFYAIQNLSFSTPTVITVTYSTGAGTTPTPVVTSVPPLAKVSVNPCQTNGNAPYSGAAVIQSSVSPIAAVGKASQTSGTQPSFTTAFLAQGSGASRLAVPYVRWSPSNPGTGFRSAIAIQNIGATTIPTGGLMVSYYDLSGALVNTCHSASALAPGAKVNSNVAAAFAGGVDFSCTAVQPSSGFTYTFSGAAVIAGPTGSNLIAVIRNSTPAPSTQIHTEDFNAILLP